jgi:protoporphyrinogen oxidase
MKPNRRELLATMLGVPAALAAGCSSSRVPDLPPGEIVGPSVDFGHRLRDGERPMPKDDQWSKASVVIVGGGVAGLAAAWRLRRAGINDFVLLELEPDPGGTARSGSGGNGRFPWGAHYVPAPMAHHRHMIDLLNDMGMIVGIEADGTPMIAESALCRDPQERIFYRGRWYEGLYLHAGESTDDIRQFQAFHRVIDNWVVWRDSRGRRAFTLPVADCSDDPFVASLDRETMADWLGRYGFTSPRLKWLVNYACRDDYGATAEHVSAWAGLFYFVARINRPGSEAQPLLTWPEGNGRFVRFLADRAKQHMRTGWGVSDIISRGNDRQTQIDVIAASSDRQARGYRTNRVIFAAPQYMAKHALRDYRLQTPEHVHEFEYGAWMVANLHLRDRPAEVGAEMAWDNVLIESPSLGYVVNTHQIGRDHGPTTFTYYYALCDADPKQARRRLLQSDWRDWADVALTDLTTAHSDIRRHVERLDIMRWGHAMIRPKPGFIWGGARRNAARPHRGIHFAGADLSGIALFEEAFHHGVRAAEEVLEAVHV